MSKAPPLPLPKSWPTRVKSAVLYIISLARFAVVYSRGWAADSPNGRVRLKAENERLLQEVSLFRDEIRIKDTRIESISPHKRPHLRP